MKLILKIITICSVVFLWSCTTTVQKSGIPGGKPNLKQAAKINVQLASGYIKRKQYEVAKEKLDKAIENDSSYVPAYTTMAVLMDILGENTEAENYYLEAMNIDPHNPELRNNYGTFLCKHGKIDQALEQFQTAIKNQFYETPQAAHANMGYCLMQAKNPDFQKAEKHLRAALKVNPNMPSALIGMGELGIKTKRFLMARAYMQRYHEQARATSTSLWYQIQAEKALGDEKYYLKLSRRLLNEFPESEEAKLLLKSANQ
jgi:type IV pilus assembly protein PilF